MIMENFENIQNSNNPLLISTTDADPMLSAALSNDCLLSPLSGLIDGNSCGNNNSSTLNHHQTDTFKNFQFYDIEDDNFYHRESSKHSEYYNDRFISQMIMPCFSETQTVLPSISTVTESKLLKENNTINNLLISDNNLLPLELTSKTHYKQSFHSPNNLLNLSSCNQFMHNNDYSINNNYHNHDDNNINSHNLSPTSSSIYLFDNLQQSVHHQEQNNANKINEINQNNRNGCFNFDESNDLLKYKLHNFNNNYMNNVLINDNSIISLDAPLSATTTESTSCSSSIDLKSNNLCLNDKKCFQLFNNENNSIQSGSDNEDNEVGKIDNNNEIKKSNIEKNDNENKHNYINLYNMQQNKPKKNLKYKMTQNMSTNNLQKVNIKYEYDRISNTNDNRFNNYNMLNGNAKQLLLSKSNNYNQSNVRIQVTNINNNEVIPKSVFFQVIYFLIYFNLLKH